MRSAFRRLSRVRLCAACGCGKSEPPPRQPSTSTQSFANAAISELGKQRWARTCAMCHVRGEGGAPKIGDAAAWRPRLAQGEDVRARSRHQRLQQHAAARLLHGLRTRGSARLHSLHGKRRWRMNRLSRRRLLAGAIVARACSAVVRAGAARIASASEVCPNGRCSVVAVAQLVRRAELATGRPLRAGDRRSADRFSRPRLGPAASRRFGSFVLGPRAD